MSRKRKVEVLSAGCPLCEDAVKLIQSIACPSCDVVIQDIRNPEIAKRARDLGVKSVPAVVVDNRLASCCINAGVDEATLREEGIGIPL